MLWVLGLHGHLCSMSCGAHRGQKRASDLPGAGVTEGCKLSCRCWALNLDPLQKQLEHLSPEPSPPSPLENILNRTCFACAKMEMKLFNYVVTIHKSRE